MKEKLQQLIELCQLGNLRKIEKFIKAFGFECTQGQELRLLTGCLHTQSGSRKNRNLHEDKKKCLNYLQVVELLLTLGLEVKTYFTQKKADTYLHYLWGYCIEQPQYLKVLEMLSNQKILPSLYLYQSLAKYLKVNDIELSKEFCQTLASCHIDLNACSGLVIKSLLGSEHCAKTIFSLFQNCDIDLHFYSYEITHSCHPRIKILLEAKKLEYRLPTSAPSSTPKVQKKI